MHWTVAASSTRSLRAALAWSWRMLCRPASTEGGIAIAATTLGTARHGTARHGTARHGTARHGTARHGAGLGRIRTQGVGE
jgi:hypothetical protein